MDDIIKTWPERIWLQGGETAEPEKFPGCGEDVTWCNVPQEPGDVEYVRADLVAELRARIAELEARQEPEGWQAVPKEPTPEMENAACEAADNGKFSGAYLRAIYRAMLAAAPSADSGEVKP